MSDLSSQPPLLSDGEGVDRFFTGYPQARAIFDSVLIAAQTLGPVTLRVTKSQVALIRERPFAWTWIPGMYLRGKAALRAAPLALSFSFPEPRLWPRWKEIYPAGNKRFTHHVELWTPEDVDDGIRGWLVVAWESG